MNRILATVVAAAALVATAVLGGQSADAEAGRWKLGFEPGELSAVVAGSGVAATHYYLPYVVTNGTDEARRPRLRLEVRTERGGVFADRYDPAVTKAASATLRVEALASTGSLRAKDLAAGASATALANFGEVDPNADELTVRVYGLWDPIVRTARGRVLRENRVLVLRYDRSGDEYDRVGDALTFRSSEEEVEGEPVELYAIGRSK